MFFFFRMDASTFDLEEMEDAEREELEAMLYAQVHHAAPDATAVVEPLHSESPILPPEPAGVKIGQLKTDATTSKEHCTLTNGFDHPPSANWEGQGRASVCEVWSSSSWPFTCCSKCPNWRR